MYTLQNSLFDSIRNNHTALNAGVMRVLAKTHRYQQKPCYGKTLLRYRQALYVCPQLDLAALSSAGFS